MTTREQALTIANDLYTDSLKEVAIGDITATELLENLQVIGRGMPEGPRKMAFRMVWKRLLGDFELVPYYRDEDGHRCFDVHNFAGEAQYAPARPALRVVA